MLEAFKLFTITLHESLIRFASLLIHKPLVTYFSNKKPLTKGGIRGKHSPESGWLADWLGELRAINI